MGCTCGKDGSTETQIFHLGEIISKDILGIHMYVIRHPLLIVMGQFSSDAGSMLSVSGISQIVINGGSWETDGIRHQDDTIT